MIRKISKIEDDSEIRLNKFFENSYGKVAKGVNRKDAKGGYFQPENLESSEFIGP